MRRVFDGGDGLIRGGIDERSRESGVCVPLEAGLEDCETGGEVLPFDMVVTLGKDYPKRCLLLFPSRQVSSLLRSGLRMQNLQRNGGLISKGKARRSMPATGIE